MKTFFYFIMLVLIGLSVSAQTIEINTAYLTKSDSRTKVYLDDDISRATQVFGAPSDTEDYFFEMDNKKGKIYTYNGNKVYIIDNKIVSLDISTNAVLLGIDGDKTFKIGDKIVETKSVIPHGPDRTTTLTDLKFLGKKVESEEGSIKGFNYAYYQVLYLSNTDRRLVLYFDSSKALINADLGE
ncbi:hypothetical protein [Sinomicrobium sp. M5D2P17]